MDALREKKYKVYFGGSYTESWSAENMSVIYADRRWVYFDLINGSWTAVGGDEALCDKLNSPDCPGLMRSYFEAAACAYTAAHDCLRHGVELDCLPEHFHSCDNALVAPELMRLLMDDCGYSINSAYGITVRCCDDCRALGIDPESLRQYQPRTAHVINLLRKTCANLLSVEHISLRGEYREPLGAVCCGEDVRLSVKVLSGEVRSMYLVLRDIDGSKDLPMSCEGSLWTVKFKAPDKGTALWYCFKLESEGSSQWLCPDSTGFRGRLRGREDGGFRLTVYLKDFKTPDWFKKARMYQIFPDRFAFSDDGTAEKGIAYHKALGQTAELHKSLDEEVRYLPRPFEKDYIPDDFYGGTFKGIEQKLPYLSKLGINCLYLNPIVEARSNHRYDTSDYLRPDPILGTLEDFERLCESAKALGMSIILDGVYSHTGADSVYFNLYKHYPGMGACQGESSPYYNWYDFKHFPDSYRCWWGFTELPEVEETNSDYDKFVLTGENSVVKTWLRRGAAGWRLDVADEIPDEVLTRLRAAVKSEDKEAPIIGEVWEDAVIKVSYGKLRNYALGYSLDSVMNYPLRSAILDFVHARCDAHRLRDFLIAQQMNYPKPMYYVLMNLLGSHDRERLLTNLAADTDFHTMSRDEQLKLVFTEESYAKAEKLEALAAAIIYSLPGVPSLYYGDEQGMRGVCDPFNRRPFKDVGHKLCDIYAELINTRAQCEAMSTGEVQFFAPGSDVLMILRYIKNKRDAFGKECENSASLTVINRSAEPFMFEADCSAAEKGLISGTVEAQSYKILAL